jgi:hypothetical protein
VVAITNKEKSHYLELRMRYGRETSEKMIKNQIQTQDGGEKEET